MTYLVVLVGEHVRGKKDLENTKVKKTKMKSTI